MSFPETRPTLIQRIATDNREADWQEFLSDYWRPICRFAARWGNLSFDDAEDVASATFEILVSKDLLSSWASKPAAKLRSLLCQIIRNLLSNQSRVNRRRQELLKENVAALKKMDGIYIDEAVECREVTDAFFETWVDEVVQEAVDALFLQCQSFGQADVFRVLHGRVCEQLSVQEIAQCLNISPDTAHRYFKQGRKQLDESLRQSVQSRVEKYAAPQDVKSEFEAEWQALSESLMRRGGLESALQQSNAGDEKSELKLREQRSISLILSQLKPSH